MQGVACMGVARSAYSRGYNAGFIAIASFGDLCTPHEFGIGDL